MVTFSNLSLIRQNLTLVLIGQGLVNDPTAPTTTRDHRFAGGGTATGIQAQSIKWDPTEGGEFNTRQSGLRDPYRDNTSGFTTRGTETGTGGSGFNSTHRNADQQFQARQPVPNRIAETEASDGNHPFDRTDFGNERKQSLATGASKPSMSDRLKGKTFPIWSFPSCSPLVTGSVQMAAGKVSGNQAMVERGEERKLGENADGQY